MERHSFAGRYESGFLVERGRLVRAGLLVMFELERWKRLFVMLRVRQSQARSSCFGHAATVTHTGAL